jgi:Rieske Fe-S protein
MGDDPEQLNEHVEDLLADRQPERTPLADEAALRARQVAAMFRAARPGAGLPTPEFLRHMQQSIEGWVRERHPAPPPAKISRRTIITGALGGMAAGVVAVLGVEGALRRPSKLPSPDDATTQLVVDGVWTPVMALTALTQGVPTHFAVGAIDGYLMRLGTNVRGLSGVCTHMGCLLNWSTLRTRFECPCHGATFDVQGKPTGWYTEGDLRPLPALRVRVQDGQVEVLIV